jgi:hypothetical protein
VLGEHHERVVVVLAPVSVRRSVCRNLIIGDVAFGSMVAGWYWPGGGAARGVVWMVVQAHRATQPSVSRLIAQVAARGRHGCWFDTEITSPVR